MTADQHRVVVNQHGHFSLWPVVGAPPAGWRDTGFTGDRQACLDQVAREWTEIHPSPLSPAPPDGVEARVDPHRCAARGRWVPLPDLPVHALIRARNLADPQAVALRTGDRVVTRGELDVRSRRWSAELVRRGARRHRPLAMLLPRSIEAVVAIVAILDSGAGYLPLPWTDPADRVRQVLADAGDPPVLTVDASDERLRGYPGPVVTVGQLDTAADPDPSPPSPAGTVDTAGPDGALRCSGADLAFVMYTSGTTGRPKGVRGLHRQLVNYVSWCAEEFAMAPGERAVLHAPLHFVGSVMSVFTPLTAGWELTVVPEPTEFGDLIKATAAAPCGFLKITPSHVRAMTALGGVDGIARQVMITSETLYLTPELHRWMADSPGTRFANQYGMSETCGGTWWWIPADTPPGQRVPVGRPIHNSQTYVLGVDGQPVPFGEIGELHMAGAVISDGYHGGPALTAERWVPHPWGATGERLLRTGDLARMAPDGTVEIVGRADRQVKVRGHRVELPTVEDALRRCPGVSEAVVVGAGDGAGTQLVAYVRPTGAPVPVAELRRQAARLLPEAAVPARIVYLATYPMTPNGKVDQQRLADVEPLRPPVGVEFVAPGSPVEQTLSRILAEVLDLDSVGVLDDFFDLGGDSLRVVEATTRIEEALDVDLAIGDLFDHPTVRALAGHLASRSDGDQR
ncbi:amino acid adenylation domain-containing protein [Micromonospora matsumotoense]|uniref:amino acid adenylation domain-containing protein n=1 Tax=Micromonospora matsumotoense TaxID=121616 RepID=UPI0033C468C8